MVSLIQRRSLLEHPTVRSALDQLWRCAALHPDGDLKSCPAEEYAAMAARLRAALNPARMRARVQRRRWHGGGPREQPSPDNARRGYDRDVPTSCPPHRPGSDVSGGRGDKESHTPTPPAFTGWSGDRHGYHFRASPNPRQLHSGRRVAFAQFQHSLFEMAGAWHAQCVHVRVSMCVC